MYSSSYPSRRRSKDCVICGVGMKKNGLVWRAVATVLLSLVLLAFYYFSLNFSFFPFVMWGYMIVLAVLVTVYLIYNRGMSRNGITEDMLPDEWDVQKKKAFVDDAKMRMSKSRWMLVFIIAFIVTFVAEAVTLFVLPAIKRLF